MTTTSTPVVCRVAGLGRYATGRTPPISARLSIGRRQGHVEQLEKPSSSHRAIGGAGQSYNRYPGKSAEDETAAARLVVARKRVTPVERRSLAASHVFNNGRQG